MKRKTLLMMMLLCFAFLGVARAQNSLTVYEDGTATNSYVPVYGTWADAYLKCEFVIPAEEILPMSGGTISAMAFHVSSLASAVWTGTFQVFLKEVDFTSISEFTGDSDATIVYEGTLDGTQSTMAIDFQSSYTYGGGNLLVGVYQIVNGNYKGCSFYGQTVSGACVQGYNSSSLDAISPVQRDFIPRTTFTYSGGTAVCSRPTELSVALTSGNGSEATLSWTEMGGATSWQICLNDDEANLITVSTNPYKLTGLTAETPYTAKVRAYCDASSQSSWSSSVSFTPTNAYMLTVNDGANTSAYVPVYGYWADNFSKSQFIIPANDLDEMLNGTISKLTFYAGEATASWGAATFEVYMAVVDNTTFESATPDWSTMDKVMDAGSLSISDNKMEVTLTNPYQYLGGNLMIGVLQTTKGSYKSCTWYGMTQEGNTAIGGYESSKALALYQFLPKTTFVYEPGVAPTCFKPTNLAVNDVDKRTAVVSWSATGDETQWQLCLNDNEAAPITVSTNPYTLTDLTPETTYTVKVRAYCGSDDQSIWTGNVAFTTLEACPAPTVLTVSDITAYSANISWTSDNNSFQLQYLEEPEEPSDMVGFEDGTLGDWTTIDADGDGYMWYVLQNSALPDSDLPGHNGSDGHATSASYQGAALTPDNYLVSPLVTLGGSITFYACAQDADWAAEHFGVAVSTTDNTDASAFTTIKEFDMTAKGVGAYTSVTRSGNRAQGTWYKYTVDLSDYSGQGYVAIRHFNCTDFFRLNVDDIYFTQPGDPEPEWINVSNAANPYAMTNLTPETTYEVRVRSNCGSDGYSDWVTTTFTTLPSCIPPVDLVVSDITAKNATLAWTVVGEEAAWQLCINNDETSLLDVTENPYVIEGLDPATTYSVKMRAVCDEETHSAWSSPVSFTTEEACPAPTDVVVSDITTKSANISWTSNNDNFDLRYAVVGGGTGESLEYGFEGDFEGWTTIDADGDSYSWNLGSSIGLTTGHNGSTDLVYSQSYDNNVGVLTPDNYLVSPQIMLGGSISFYACAQDASYPAEKFAVAVSTTSNTDASAFTTLQSWTMTAKSVGAYTPVTRSGNRAQGAWYQYTVDLSAFAGMGYVAIRHYDCSDMYFLDVDDITIVEGGAGEVEWIELNGISNPFDLEGLDIETTYMVQVRSNCGDIVSAWTSSVYFTTLESCPKPSNVQASNLRPTSAELSWTENGDATAWQIAYSTESGFDPDAASDLIDVTKNPYTLDDLVAETTYYVYVRSNCGDEYSSWSIAPCTFTTPNACDIPNSFAIYNDDLTADHISLTWEGYQDSYNIQWRIPESREEFYASTFDDFDSWTTVDCHESSGLVLNFTDGGAAFGFHWSTTPPQYLISPELDGIPAGAELSFIYACYNASYPETFMVGYSTTTNDVSAFTWSDVVTSTNVYNSDGFQEYTQILPEGVKYFAIQYTSNDQYWLFIGYPGIYGDVIPAGEWMSDYGVTIPYTIEGLEPETQYEFQVQGVTASCPGGVTEWTDSYYFTTPAVALTPITEIHIDNFAIPAWGEEPQYDAAAPVEEGYELIYMDWSWYDYDTDDGDMMASGDVFDNEDYVYYAYFALVPEDGYTFADEVTVYVNGDPSIIETQGYSSDGYYWAYTIDYSVEAPIEDGEQTAEFAAGWNWYSSYLEYGATALTDLEDAIAGQTDVATIKSQADFLSYESGIWNGNIDFTNESMYMININEPISFTLNGEVADPAAHPIALASNGYSWISFLSPVVMNLDEALSNLTPTEGDVIKSQAGFSSYTETEGWSGSVTQLVPGLGYMYFNNSSAENTLVYPTGAKGVALIEPEVRYWTNDVHRFATNLSMMVTLDESQFSLREGNYEIGAFVGDECRGSARVQRVGDHYVAFLSVSGEDGETVSFRLYDVYRNEEFASAAEEQITYVANAITGSVKAPVTLHFRSTSVNEDANSISLFPNPANDKVNLRGVALQTVRVYDALGQLVIAENCENVMNLELDFSALSAGVYTVNIRTMNGTMINKMVVKE